MPAVRVPQICRHKATGQGVVRLSGKDHYLGRWPEGSRKPPAAVQAEYDRLIVEWLAAGRRSTMAPPTTGSGAGQTVEDLILAFWEHAERHYRRLDGTQTSELDGFRLSLRPLRRLYGSQPASEFSPLKLKAVRQQMIDAGLCRRVVNERVGRIVRVFKWAVSEELVPESVHSALRTVAGLARGRTAARETEPVRPMAVAVVNATLPFLSPPLQAAVQVQRLTGMRPGEVLCIRPADLTTTGELWEYSPSHHKSAWRGRGRVVVLGPKAQTILKPLLTIDSQAYVLNPRVGRAAWAADARSRRRTKLFPCDRRRAARRTKKPDCLPGGRYAVATYEVAVRRASDRADHAARQAAENAQAVTEGREVAAVPAVVRSSDRIIPRWHPNQLRHSHGTEVRRQFGLEHAQVALGHSRADVTQVYAEANLNLARQVAVAIG